MPLENGQPIDQNGFAVERRRPGRRDVNPELIPLLRRPAGNGILPEDAALGYFETTLALRPGQDALDAARGIAMSLVLSVPFWGIVGMLSLALHR